MKPFDLEAALAGEPVVLRDGRKGFVKFRLPGVDDGSWSMSGYRIEKDDSKAITNWRRNGTMYSVPSEADIVGMWEEPPQTVKIGNFEFPKPESEPLGLCEKYYIPQILTSDKFLELNWIDDRKTDVILLKRGLVHKTKEAAIAHAKVIIAISQGKTSLDD